VGKGTARYSLISATLCLVLVPGIVYARIIEGAKGVLHGIGSQLHVHDTLVKRAENKNTHTMPPDPESRWSLARLQPPSCSPRYSLSLSLVVRVCIKGEENESGGQEAP